MKSHCWDFLTRKWNASGKDNSRRQDATQKYGMRKGDFRQCGLRGKRSTINHQFKIKS
jgi:hypothetical protein